MGPGAAKPPVARTGGTTPSGPAPSPVRPAAGRTTPRGRPKGLQPAWMARIDIPWEARFPAVELRQGYEPTPAELGAALRVAPDQGGWERKDRASLVVFFDSSDEKHGATLRMIGDDRRWTSAAPLFNCFKVDVRGYVRPGSEIRLAIFAKDGAILAEAAGESRIRKGFDLVEKAWESVSGKPLAKSLPALDNAVTGIAWCDDGIEHLAANLVCADCGLANDEAAKRLAEVRSRRNGYLADIEKVRRADD